MATDVPEWECTNRYYGPPVNCHCKRFYPDTFCDPPRFFYFEPISTVTEPIWAWLNNVHWLNVRDPMNDSCKWRWNWYVLGDPANLSLEYKDNPDFDGDPNTARFIALFTLQNNDLEGLPVEFEATILFGRPIDDIQRNLNFLVSISLWRQTVGNPLLNGPDADITFEARLCNPDWDPEAIPQP